MQVVQNQRLDDEWRKLAWHSSTYGLKMVGNVSVILYQLYEKPRITNLQFREWSTGNLEWNLRNLNYVHRNESDVYVCVQGMKVGLWT